MDKKYTVTVNNLTENDMRDIFYDALTKMGVNPGDTIPREMSLLKETVIGLMFKVDSKESEK